MWPSRRRGHPPPLPTGGHWAAWADLAQLLVQVGAPGHGGAVVVRPVHPEVVVDGARGQGKGGSQYKGGVLKAVLVVEGRRSETAD